MERDITKKLIAWKDDSFRKPLILKGARQVGKTWVLKDLGKRYFSDILYISLEKIAPNIPSEYARFFEATNDPHRILQGLSLYVGVTVVAGKTLIIFDEIQDCPAALRSLKYFAEGAPEYHIACAGSLLGVALASEDSFPVGKINFLQMYPMTFSEFLRGVGESGLDDFCQTLSFSDPLLDAFAPRLEEQLRIYLTVGGMPEAVVCWAQQHDIKQVDAVLSDLIDSYERDFAKHGGTRLYSKLSQVWHSLPSQLSRENRKFLYGLVRKGARAREYEDAITWLKDAGLIHKVFRSNKPALPLSAYADLSAFKIYCLDVGVLRRLSRLDASVFFGAEAFFQEFKGAFSENLVLQSLVSSGYSGPFYWTKDKPKHEIDFLIQSGHHVIPIEVKSGASVNSSSLRYYTRAYCEQTPLRIRFSLRGLSFENGLLNIPLYLADCTTRLINLASGEIEALFQQP